AAESAELAERCGLSQKAARAVRAAARLALEDQAAAKERLTAGGPRARKGSRSAASLAAEAAAEPSGLAAAETGEEYRETR
ncbi:MAG: excinuclease ABC subunit C, partial [Treponema sp.]|nr:excinuclease ABC subunit C [Treponema sp.]